jgi:peptidyl-prolyl cis-trans isomerase C
MAKAAARHILVPAEDTCNDLLTQIQGGADFAELAKTHSQCPSGQSGGDLGVFGPGQMVPEFDQAVFNGTIGEVQGPIKTQFGYHLLEVTMRTD